MPLKKTETRSRLAVHVASAQRLLMWHVFSGRTPHYLVTEYPRSGGTWLSNLISEYLDIPFPRNARPQLFPQRTCLLHGHQLYSPHFKNVFCLLRDGRDCITSAYFHILFDDERNPRWLTKRQRRGLPFDDYDAVKENMPAFIEFMFTHRRGRMSWFSWADFVDSWLDKDVTILRYEDMLADTVGTVANALRQVTKQEVDMLRLEAIVERHSFAKVANRQAGTEDRHSNIRKGIAGDWRNHFTRETCEVFDHYAGDALIRAGYEIDHQWARIEPTAMADEDTG